MVASPFDILLQMLARLDRKLEKAVTLMQALHASAEGEHEEYQGLYITQEEVGRLLAQEPVSQVFSLEQQAFSCLLDQNGPFSWLVQCFSLSTFASEVLLIALAPEVDRRYERIYAYLQDDISRKRPSIDLVLTLLCSSAEERLAHYQQFGSAGPLIQHGLLHLVSDVHQVETTFLTHAVKVDEQIMRFLLGDTGLDPRLLSCCQRLVASEEKKQTEQSGAGWALQRLVLQSRAEHLPVRLYFCGPRYTGQRERAEELATLLASPLFLVEVERLVTLDRALFEQVLSLLFREARLYRALLFFDDLDILLLTEYGRHYHRLLVSLAAYDGEAVLCGTRPWIPSEHLPEGVTRIPFALPDFTERKTYWNKEAIDRGLSIEEEDLNALASSFRLTTGQIAQALATVCHNWRWAGVQCPEAERVQPARNDLFLAARAQTGHELSALARKVDARLTWNDLVLPREQIEQLQELCDQARYKHVVYQQWGFARKFSSGNGLSALFSGPPGTGKTMAAGIIAANLGLDLYTIDLSRVVSKYIGETEKNLQAVFAVAEHSNAILFFDEADALFGKRSQVKDAHDRYANIEIGYLLQQMEEYDGIAFLATNLRANLDDAFLRRLKFSIEFPVPDEPYRLRIWQDCFPSEAPLKEDIDFPFLARQFKLAGGNIKNIVLNASFLAAAQDEPVGMRQVILATHREYQKMGKMSLESEFGQYYRMVRAHD